MKTNAFWEIIKDRRSKTFEVLRKSYDDTRLTNETVEMQKHGMEVNCETPLCSDVAEADIPNGYKALEMQPEPGLMARLRLELKDRKASHESN